MFSRSKVLTALLIVCYIIFEGNGAPPQKIIGGKFTKLDEFPYLVSLRENDKHYCAGAIISEQHILTAAHCVIKHMQEPYDNIVVVSGTNQLFKSQGEKHHVSKATAHPNFVLKPEMYYPNDIAVLKLSAPIKFNEHQNKINLPSSPVTFGSKGLIAGWGQDSNRIPFVSYYLKKAPVTIQEITECVNLGKKENYVGKLCGNYTDGQGFCNGDSGGPMAVGDEVVGVISWGTQICGEGNPDYYTNVYEYMDFIQQQMT